MSMSMEALQMAMADDVDQWEAADDPQGTLSMMAMLLGGADATLGGTNDVFLGGGDFHVGGASDMLLGGTSLEDLLGGGTYGGNGGGHGGGNGGLNDGSMVYGQGQCGPGAMGSDIDNRITSVGGQGHTDGALLEAAYNGTQPLGYDYEASAHASAHAIHNGALPAGSNHGASAGQWEEPQARDASFLQHSSIVGLDSSAVLDTSGLVLSHAHSAIAPDSTNLWMLQQQQLQQQLQQQQHLLLQSEPHTQAWPGLKPPSDLKPPADQKPPSDLKPERRTLVVQSCDYKGGRGGRQGAQLVQMPPGLCLAPPVVPALATAATTPSAAALGNSAPAPAAAGVGLNMNGSNVNASARMLFPRASTEPANAAPLGSTATAELALGGGPFLESSTAGAMACGMWRSHSSSSRSRPVAAWASESGREGVAAALCEGGETPAAGSGLLEFPEELQAIEAVAAAAAAAATFGAAAAAAAAAGSSGGESAARVGMRKGHSSSSARPRVTQLGARGGSKRAKAAGGTGMNRSRSSHVLLTTTPASTTPALSTPVLPSLSPPLPASVPVTAGPSSGASPRAEEDGVLMEYVRCHGPRNWGALRARGLLRRPGKSCRLRWVNQLKPGLQRYGGKGCKRFSEAEAGVVLALQRAVGNKWAHIARHLPGRTDNDVKNFWNLHLKRQARLRARGGGARLEGDGGEGVARDEGNQDAGNHSSGNQEVQLQNVASRGLLDDCNHLGGDQNDGDRKGEKQASGANGDGGRDSSMNSGSPGHEEAAPASAPSLPVPSSLPPHMHQHAKPLLPRARPSSSSGRPLSAGSRPSSLSERQSKLSLHQRRLQRNSSGGGGSGLGAAAGGGGGGGCARCAGCRSAAGNNNGADSMTGTGAAAVAAAAAGAMASGDDERAAGSPREAGGEAGEAMDVAGAGSSLSALKIGEPNAQMNTLLNLEDWINSPLPAAAPPRRTGCSPFYINLSPSARRLRSPGSPSPRSLSPRSLYLRSPSPRSLYLRSPSPRALASPRHRSSPAHRVFPHPPPHPSSRHSPLSSSPSPHNHHSGSQPSPLSSSSPRPPSRPRHPLSSSSFSPSHPTCNRSLGKASALEPREVEILPHQAEILPSQQLHPIQMESRWHNPELVSKPAGNPVAEPLAGPTAEPIVGGMSSGGMKDRSVCRSMSMESSVRRGQHQQGRKGSGAAAASASLQASPIEDVLVPAVRQQNLHDYQEALQYHDQQHLNQHLHQHLTPHEQGRETTSGTKHGSTGGGGAPIPKHRRHHNTAAPPLTHGPTPDTTAAAGYSHRTTAGATPCLSASEHSAGSPAVSRAAASPAVSHGGVSHGAMSQGAVSHGALSHGASPAVSYGASQHTGTGTGLNRHTHAPAHSTHSGPCASACGSACVSGSSPPSASLKANAGVHGIRVWHLGAPAAALVPPVIDVSSVAAAAHVGLGQSGDAGGLQHQFRRHPTPAAMASLPDRGALRPRAASPEIDWDRLDKTRMFVVGAGLFSGLTVALYPLSVIKTRLQANTLKGIQGVTELTIEGSFDDTGSSSSSNSSSGSSSSGGSSGRSESRGGSGGVVGGTGRWLHLSDMAAAGLASAVGGMCASLATQAVVVPVDVISSRLVAQQGDLPHHATRPAPTAPGAPLAAATAAASATPAAAAAAARAAAAAGAGAAGGGAGAGAVRYKGGIDALVTILRTEGPRGLYRGFGLSVLTYAPSGFIWWGTYGATQRLFWSSYDRLWAPAGNTAAPPLLVVVGVQVGGGMCAGLASALATTPLDTVKTRIQVGRRSGAAVTVAAVVRQLVEQDGVRGLYRGFAPRCASTMLWGTAMVSTYEYLKRLCAKDSSDEFDGLLTSQRED
ncbi:unnamed protein product [Closterium sp. Yama58-4]|nr:unnamed protein product [Closterium sp. Yama58-4]